MTFYSTGKQHEGGDFSITSSTFPLNQTSYS